MLLVWIKLNKKSSIGSYVTDLWCDSQLLVRQHKPRMIGQQQRACGNVLVMMHSSTRRQHLNHCFPRLLCDTEIH